MWLSPKSTTAYEVLNHQESKDVWHIGCQPVSPRAANRSPFDELFQEQTLSFWRKRWKQARHRDFAAPVALVTASSGEVPSGSLLMLALSFFSSLSTWWVLIQHPLPLGPRFGTSRPLVSISVFPKVWSSESRALCLQTSRNQEPDFYQNPQVILTFTKLCDNVALNKGKHLRSLSLS